MHHLFRRLSALLAALFLLMACPALAEDPLYPALDHPADRYVQSLCVMSQQDSVFEGVNYNKGWLTARGCQPLSVANGVIAAFGIDDRDTAIDVVLESTRLMVPDGKSRSNPVEADRFGVVIDPDLRAAEAESYPALAATVGAYPGKVIYQHKVLNAGEIMELICAQTVPAIVGSRMYVVDTWEDVVRIAYALHDMGMDEATITLARAGVGKDSAGAPLRSGKFGHYLTLLLHVGAFVESGAVYVLDSLPRALEHEPEEGVLRSRYHFPEDRPTAPFNSTFSASRISPTIIKFVIKEEKLAGLAALSAEERIAQHTSLLSPFLVFGSCSMLVSLR